MRPGVRRRSRSYYQLEAIIDVVDLSCLHKPQARAKYNQGTCNSGDLQDTIGNQSCAMHTTKEHMKGPNASISA